MNSPQAESDALASGLKRAEIEELLRHTEPMRLAALTASLNLSAGAALTILGSILSGGSILFSFVAAIAAGSIWQVSNRRALGAKQLCQWLGCGGDRNPDRRNIRQ
jgi:hypothetical protein